MDQNGGAADTSLRCERDGEPTRLRCAECDAPICPKCMVRTDVGLRCPSCGADAGPPVPAARRTPRLPVIIAVAVVVALVVAAGSWAASRGSGAPDEEADGGERVVVPSLSLGRGDLPGGATWSLDARRDGAVCTTLTITPTPPQERCLRRGTFRPVGNINLRTLRGPDGPVFFVLGQVSDRAERVRIAPDRGAPWEVPTLGGGTGLGVRFFTTHFTANEPTTYIALGGDGAELGRAQLPKISPPRS